MQMMKLKAKSQNADAAFDSLLQEMEVAQYKHHKKSKASNSSSNSTSSKNKPSVVNNKGNGGSKKKASLGNGSSSSDLKKKRKGSFELVPLKEEDKKSTSSMERDEIVPHKRASSSQYTSASSSKPKKGSEQIAPRKKAHASTSPGTTATAANIPISNKGMVVGSSSLEIQGGGGVKRPRDKENGKGIDWTSHRKVRKAGDPLELWASESIEDTHTSTGTLEPVNAR